MSLCGGPATHAAIDSHSLERLSVISTTSPVIWTQPSTGGGDDIAQIEASFTFSMATYN